MGYLVRSASLTDFAAVARSAGLDPQGLLREFELDRRCLDDPDRMIPAEKVAALLEAAAIRGDMPDFGLRMAESRKLSNLGILGLIWREEPTVRRGLASISRYMRLHNEGLAIRVEDWQDAVIVHIDLMVAQGVPALQATDLSMAVLHKFLGAALGKGWRAEAVCLTRNRPEDPAPYRRCFSQLPEFNREFNGFVCRPADLDQALPAGDPEMASQIRRLLEARLADAPLGEEDRVRQLIRLLLPLGRCSVEDVARLMGTDRRTVHRHLAARGKSFSALLGEVRADLACAYLANPDRTLAEAAEYLGFSGNSALSRWFRGRFGTSPRGWRKAAKGPRPPPR